MKKQLFQLGVCALLALPLGAWEKVFSYDAKHLPIQSSIIKTVLPEGVKTPDGEQPMQLSFTVPRSELLYPPHFQYPFPMKGLKNGDKITLSFWIKGAKGDAIEYRITEIMPYSNRYTETAKLELSGEWQKAEYTFTLKDLAVEAYCAMPRLVFAKFTQGSPLFVGPVHVTKVEK